MRTVLRPVAAFARQPLVNFIAGVVLLVTSIFDLVGIDSLLGLDVAVQHGVALLGLQRVLQHLPDVLEGSERLATVEEPK
jgi:hypothetical protein